MIIYIYDHDSLKNVKITPRLGDCFIITVLPSYNIGVTLNFPNMLVSFHLIGMPVTVTVTVTVY